MSEGLADQARRIADAERRHVIVRANQLIRQGRLTDAEDLAARAGLAKVALRIRRLRGERTT